MDIQELEENAQISKSADPEVLYIKMAKDQCIQPTLPSENSQWWTENTVFIHGCLNPWVET